MAAFGGAVAAEQRAHINIDGDLELERVVRDSSDVLIGIVTEVNHWMRISNTLQTH
jgi:hypothetical protein